VIGALGRSQMSESSSKRYKSSHFLSYSELQVEEVVQTARNRVQKSKGKFLNSLQDLFPSKNIFCFKKKKKKKKKKKNLGMRTRVL
jgi:hypothetical protein